MYYVLDLYFTRWLDVSQKMMCKPLEHMSLWEVWWLFFASPPSPSRHMDEFREQHGNLLGRYMSLVISWRAVQWNNGPHFGSRTQNFQNSELFIWPYIFIFSYNNTIQYNSVQFMIDFIMFPFARRLPLRSNKTLGLHVE